ncbi:glycine zipper 2TM domain-containing protein [Undibacterium sp. TJN19]|uniref:glycine zipper 2TM domain-containing protein n=1 Tax=Undibacterium sp. TJN19 TaxID=3413055 RepID=UPI003BF0C480
MEQAQTANRIHTRIHPLVAGAAASVILVSLLGAAAICGFLPNSHGSAQQASASLSANDMPPVAAATVQSVMNYAPPANLDYVARPKPVQVSSGNMNNTGVIHHTPVRHYQTVETQEPVARNSPLGIGLGAVVGGLLGNQVGGGNGRTLATIAGAVGGGYIGNEVAKRNP